MSTTARRRCSTPSAKRTSSSSEAGGITQHIGAYQVEKDGQKITFIDTPGHEAFTAMRARGAQATDIAILVVAADDGVMPQTIESINHARAAGVPIIVAINKIDKPGADPNRVRTELLQHEIVVEAMGGDTLDVEVSALKHTNLDKLLEAILLQAEILEPAGQSGPRGGRHRHRGASSTAAAARSRPCWCSAARCSVGDIVVAGGEWGRVRALIDDRGEQVREAGPVDAGRGPRLPGDAGGGRPARRRGERGARPRDHRVPPAT